MKNRLLLFCDGYTSPLQGVTVPAFEQPQSIPFIVDRVRKDYAQFDIEVTNVNDPNDTRPTAIIAVGGGSATQGGSSFNGGFYNAFPNDGFVYATTLQNNPKWIADAISHEAGHLFGLTHQSQWANGVMVDVYRRDGAIMGSPYFIDNPFWTIGQTPTGATQDDVATLTRILGAASPPLPTPPPVMIRNDCQITITAPLTVQAGATFPATFTVKNTGSNVWLPWDGAKGYNLGAQQPQDNSRWGKVRLPLPITVVSDFGTSITASFTAPTIPGDYPFAWDMVEEFVSWFGKIASQTIRVTQNSGAIPVSINNVPGIWTPTGEL